MRNFKQLKIWQKGFDIAAKSFKLINTFPKEEKLGISLHVTTSAVSIPSNIAEGRSRTSEKDIQDSLRYHWVQVLNWKRNC